MADLHRPACRGLAAARRRTFRAPRAGALLALLLLPACGSDPTGPGVTPPPTPTPSLPPGPVAGRYLLQVTPSASCPAPIRAFSFPMDAASGGAAPKTGTQAVLTGDPGALEAEFLSEGLTLRGGIGTTADGALANETLRLWIRAIASGVVTRAGDGRGEVRAGSLMGDLAFAGAAGDEGDLGSCSARDHAFTLSAR